MNTPAMYGQRPMSRPNPEEKFKELDVDGNGSLNTDEMQAMADRFSQKSGQEISTSDILEKFDADGNGSLEMSEMPQHQKGQFSGAPPFGDSGMTRSNPNPLDSLLKYLSSNDEEQEESFLMDVTA